MTSNLVHKNFELPATVEDLMARRKSAAPRNINDFVDDIHIALWPDPTYRRLLEAVYHEQAVQGATDIDDTLAVLMIHTYATEKGIEFVVQQNYATIRQALKVVMRRYNISRKARRNMIAGEVIPDDGDDNDEHNIHH